MAMDGRRPEDPRFLNVRGPELRSEGMGRELGRWGSCGWRRFEDGGAEARDLAGEREMLEFVRARLEEEEREEGGGDGLKGFGG